jgi:hypothetical protein
MSPFGKQQEPLNFLSTTNPEELSGNRRDKPLMARLDALEKRVADLETRPERELLVGNSPSCCFNGAYCHFFISGQPSGGDLASAPSLIYLLPVANLYVVRIPDDA